MRTVILHYHLFKNAGTSIDSILRSSFGDKWVTQEFPAEGNDNSGLVAEWIKSTPDAVVFSSHTAVGPLPQIDGVKIIPIFFLRDPVARIESAYWFERNQGADTWGSQLARVHDLVGYVDARLGREGDRQCHNFQASRLAAFFPGPETEIERASKALAMLNKIGVLGIVEAFDHSLTRMNTVLQRDFPDFRGVSTHKNVSSKGKSSMSPALRARLNEVNADDFKLLRMAAQELAPS